MKNLLILVLVFALLAGAFLSRPTKADFERFIRDNATITDGQVTANQSLGDLVTERLRTFISNRSQDPVEEFLNSVEYENHYIFTNVKSKDGQPLYTGAFGQWWKRKPT